MKRIIVFFSVLFLSFVVFLVSLPFVIDVNQYKTQLFTKVQQETGIKLDVRGKIELNVFPEIALVFNDLSINDGDLLSADTLSLELKLFPLFKGNIEVKSLDITSPKVNLVVSELGKENWQISKEGDQENSSEDLLKQNNSVDKSQKSDFSVELSAINISNALFIYDNKQQDKYIKLSNFNLNTSYVKGDNPVKVSGSIFSNSPKILDEKLFLEGLLFVGEDNFSFNDINFTFGEVAGDAEMVVDFSNVISQYGFALNADVIDLNNFLGGEVSGRKLPEGSELNVGSNKVFAWSEDKIDFSLIRKNNFNFSLKANKIIYKDLSIDGIDLSVHSLHGKLTANLKELHLYDGTVMGQFILDTTTQIPNLSSEIALKDLNYSQVPERLFLSNYLDGKINSNLKLISVGDTKRQIISALQGNGNIEVNAGRVKQLDLFSMIGNIQSAFNLKDSKNSFTQFGKLMASFNIENGILNNQDLLMVSKEISFEGKGIFNLPEMTLDYRLVPKITGSYDKNRFNIQVPILIQNSILNPVFRPDLTSAVKNFVGGEPMENLFKKFKKDFKGFKGLDNEGEAREDRDDKRPIKIPIPKEIQNIFNSF